MANIPSRRENAIRRRRRQSWYRRAAAIFFGLLLAGAVLWGTLGAAQRSALARTAETRPPVVGTPVTGGHDMSFVPPTPSPRGSGPQPKAALSEKSYAFGTLSIQGQPVEHSLRILNTGTADLRITGLATSCGCTTARISADTIPPGESAEVVIRYDPSAHPQPGNYMREVYIYTNDPNQYKAVYTITATTR